MKKIMSYILNPIKEDKEGAAKMNTKIRKAIGIVGIIMAVYIIFKYIFVYVAPFLVAFLIVRILNPAAIRLQKYPCFRKVGKGSLLFCMMSLILGITGVCMWFLGVRLFAQIRSIFLHIDQYEAKMEMMIDGCCVLLNQKFGIKSEAVREVVYQNIEKMSEKIQAVNITQVFRYSVRYAVVAAEWFSVLFVIFVAVLLIIKDYDEICQKLQKYSTSSGADWGTSVADGGSVASGTASDHGGSDGRVRGRSVGFAEFLCPAGRDPDWFSGCTSVYRDRDDPASVGGTGTVSRGLLSCRSLPDFLSHYQQHAGFPGATAFRGKAGRISHCYRSCSICGDLHLRTGGSFAWSADAACYQRGGQGMAGSVKKPFLFPEKMV